MAFPLVSARYPHPSSTVNTIGFGRFAIARQNTWICWTNHFVSVTIGNRERSMFDEIDSPGASAGPIREVILDYGEVLCHRPSPEVLEEMAGIFGIDEDKF